MRTATFIILSILLIAGCSQPGERHRPGVSPVGADSGATDSGDSGTTIDPLTTDDDGDGYTEEQGDCDDAEPIANPDNLESWNEDNDGDGANDGCNGIDDDCDGTIDEGEAWMPWVHDADGDGLSPDVEPVTYACESPGEGWISWDGLDDIDCDDTDPDPAVSDPALWHPDADGDGYGDSYTDGVYSCESPGPGWVRGPGNDCDDANPFVGDC